MSKNIDIELIIAYIYDDIADSQKREEVRYSIENDSQWFSAYLDLKRSITEMESTDFEMVPDELLNPSIDVSSVVEPPKAPLFDFAWLLKPQIAMGAACMLIVAVFIYLSPTEEENGFNTTPPVGMPQFTTGTKGLSTVQDNNITKIKVDNGVLTIHNISTSQLTVSVNDKDFSLPMFNSLEIQLENGDNKVVVVNSGMDTIQDTTITVNE